MDAEPLHLVKCRGEPARESFGQIGNQTTNNLFLRGLNVLNLTRFDVKSLSLSLTKSSTFGNYTGLLTNPRSMQFMLRFEF